MAKIPHGNSKDSEKPQHLYEIKDHELPEEDDTFKYGVSGTPLKNDGSSERANNQVKTYNKASGWERFWAIVLMKGLDSRKTVLGEETKLTEIYQDSHGGELPRGMLRPDKRQKKK